ncbi:hypothetical protein CFIO01_01711 [Colletotrichum fioriniae PJ7]|uniref:DUF7136 domain-containing protein n=1 Tax=Colletotrichum fioriniae PJ7 TaxID=1445577 RepID=A0A010RGU6_9PEZI|nr:hypothetical protein CFIO01_01711 [Colletotrichum fioriniae PJ7]
MGISYSLVTIVLLFVTQLATAQLPTNAIELDLVFPRAGGKYAKTSEGFPVILSLQNPNVAYHFGWVFSWDIYKKPHEQIERLPFNTIGSILKNDTTYPDNPHIEARYADVLDVGEYTFSWTIHTGPWCNLSKTWVEYSANEKISNDTFDFTIAQGAPTPTFTGTCPTALGMINYASLTTYHGLYDGEYDDPVTSPMSCAITTNVTFTAEPCRATVNEAQATSISSQLHLGTYATASATASPTGSAAAAQRTLNKSLIWAVTSVVVLFGAHVAQ